MMWYPFTLVKNYLLEREKKRREMSAISNVEGKKREKKTEDNGGRKYTLTETSHEQFCNCVFHGETIKIF